MIKSIKNLPPAGFSAFMANKEADVVRNPRFKVTVLLIEGIVDIVKPDTVFLLLMAIAESRNMVEAIGFIFMLFFVFLHLE